MTIEPDEQESLFRKAIAAGGHVRHYYMDGIVSVIGADGKPAAIGMGWPAARAALADFNEMRLAGDLVQTERKPRGDALGHPAPYDVYVTKEPRK